MKNLEININISILKESEIDEIEKELVDKAKSSTHRSYAPYSNFSVGAAVLLDNGIIVEGSNQENCAYPSGICAEGTALFYANSRYPDKKILSLAIAARDTEGNFTKLPISPCGSCRQVFVEILNRQKSPFKVILYGLDGIYIVNSALDLMPLSFNSSFL